MPTAVNTCVLFTSSTVRVVYVMIMSRRHMVSFLFPKDDGFMRWVGTCVPWVSKPGLLGNFPPHRGSSLTLRRHSLPLKTLGTSRAEHGTVEFPCLWGWCGPSSLQDSVPRTRECSESPRPASHLTDQNTEAQSLTKGHREIADGVFGWNP